MRTFPSKPLQNSSFPKPCQKPNFQASRSSPPVSFIPQSNQSESPKPFPIPKGTTPYALAKSSEYRSRDLASAEYYYKLAISQGDRTQSAVKDLASLLHQRGQTSKACELLEKYSHLFKNDLEKYDNLLNTLKKQIDPSSSCQNKNLKLSVLNPEYTSKEVLNLFTNPIRIKRVEVSCEEIDGKVLKFAILYFTSHSSARKTLEGFKYWDKYMVEWVSPFGEVVGDAHYARQKMEEYRKYNPTFDYVIFERDPNGYVFSLPLEGSKKSTGKGAFSADEEQKAKVLLGADLYSTIFNEDAFKDF